MEFEDFLPLGWMGAFSFLGRHIYLLRGMSPVRERSVLAHELGHAYYGHTESNAANEGAASRWAASQLINAEDYRLAREGAPSLSVIADRLGVTLDVAQTYRQMRRDVVPTGILQVVAV